MKRVLYMTACASAVVIVACSSSTEGDGESGSHTGSPGSTDASVIRSIPGTSGWPTDWTMRRIDLDELRVGLPGRDDMRDGIPPIDEPTFESTEGASEWLEPREPVVMLELEARARAYPLGLLISREIVNDEFAGTPVAITYCPLCNSAVGFDRRVGGQTLRFGVSGLLRNSDLVMWDDATVSLWQQITGEAVVGELTGTQLRLIPTPIVAFGDFADRYPDGEVLSRDVNGGFYGRNPYVSYDSVSHPFLFDGELDERFPAMERIVGVVIDGESKAFPFSVLEKVRVANEELAGVPIVVMWGAPETVSALDASKIADSDAVGTGVAYGRTLGEQVLSFDAMTDHLFRDIETGSTWNLLGRAISGPLAGEELTPIVQTNHFWFAWAAFNPDSPVWTG